MKNFKRVLAIVLCVAMIVPMGIVTSFAAEGDAINANWTIYATKYGGSTPHIQADTGFSFTETANGGIFANIPTPDEYAVGAIGTVAVRSAKSANYPLTAMTYNTPVSLDGLTATINFDEDCKFSESDGSTFSFLWTDKLPVGINTTDLKNAGIDAQTSLVKNGFRGFVDEGTKGLMVTIGNSYSPYTNESLASNVNIYYFDGSFEDAIDHVIGYRWSFTARNSTQTPNADGTGISHDYQRVDYSDGLTFAVRADETLGYIVSVNGVDYCLGSEVSYFPNNNTFPTSAADADYTKPEWFQSMTYLKDNIDLSGLVGTQGYLTIGSIGNKVSSDENEYTVTSINGVAANAWNGEVASAHTHTEQVLSEEWTACTLPSYVKTKCSTCGAVLGIKTIDAKGHQYETLSETSANCTEDGVLTRKCSVCKDIDYKVTPKYGHTWTSYELTTPATATDAGERTRTCTSCKTTEVQTIPAIGSGTYSDYWTVSNYDNRTTIPEWDPSTQVLFPSVTESGALKLVDYAKYNNISDWSGIVLTKAISKFATKLDGFTATVTPLCYTESYTDKFPESMCFVWTNEPTQYDEASEYSIFTGAGISGDNMRNMSFGFMNGDPIGGEYTIFVNLLDYLAVDSYVYGTAGDGVYDVAHYIIFAHGSYYANKVAIVNVPANDAIDISMTYQPDFDASTYALAVNFNSSSVYLPEVRGRQLCQDVYYFGVAAYTDCRAICANEGASFEINSVCGQDGAFFNGNTEEAEPCGHSISDITLKAATCSESGLVSHYCTLCGYESREVTAPDETKHVVVIDEGRAPTCTKKGKTQGSHCSVCDKVLVEQEYIDKVPHTWGDWVEYPEQGIKVRTCQYCTASEQEQLACAHTYVFDKYDNTDLSTVVKVEKCSKCQDEKRTTVITSGSENYSVVIAGTTCTAIRIVKGDYKTSNAIKNAPGVKVYSGADCTALKREDGTFAIPALTEELYSVWARTSLGDFIFQVTLNNFTPTVSVDKINLKLSNIYSGVSSVLIARGKQTTWSAAKNNRIFTVTYDKMIQEKNYDLLHTFTYAVDSTEFDNTGNVDLTVVFRMSNGTNVLVPAHITVPIPSYTVNGLDIHFTGVENVKCVKRCFGTYTTLAQVKAASDCITISGSAITGGTYKHHVKHEGAVTIAIQYKNGYTKVMNFNIVQKRPTFQQTANDTVVFGDLDGLYVIRYAKGTYEKANAVKRADGCVVVRSDAKDKDGNITISGLEKGKYTFVVQYDDESQNFFYVTVN